MTERSGGLCSPSSMAAFASHVGPASLRLISAVRAPPARLVATPQKQHPGLVHALAWNGKLRDERSAGHGALTYTKATR